MDKLKWSGLIVALLLLPVLSTAQDPQPRANGNGETEEPLPPLPTAPYVREHVDALEKHIAARQSAVESATAELARRKTAADEEGLTDEEQTRRDEAVSTTESTLATLNEQLDTLKAALARAQTGPTREQLQARQRYDRLYALADQARRDLAPPTEATEANAETAPPEGDYARAIRLAEEELARIRELSARSEEFEFAKSRVYEKLSDLERIDYEIRWASERFKISVDAYDHLTDGVFAAYRRYETRAFEGLKAAKEAQAAWEQVKDTPAAELELPAPPRDVTALADISKRIEERLKGRAGTRRGRLWIGAFTGHLEEIQREIDNREDYREKLEQDAERLKTVLSDSGREAPEGDPDMIVSEPEDYQKLGAQVDDLKNELTAIRDDVARLEQERANLEAMIETKKQVERDVEAIVAQTELEISAIRWQFIEPEPGEERASKPDFEVPTFDSEPRILLFTLRERLKAENERLGAARRDTRQVVTQLDILDRRIQRLKERREEIETVLLPETREQYYEEIGKTVGFRALKVVGVFVAAWLLLFLIRRVGEPLIEGIVRRADKRVSFNADEQQRARTLMTVFMTTARVVVYVTAIMFAIAQFDVDYGPLLVAAGGVSLAVGFGAQTLVRDFFAGFFILLEGQFSIGDVVEIGGKVGTVENLNLRTTVLRSLNGDVHTIPNGEISVTTNMTKLWSRAIVDVGIAYEENTDDVAQVLEAIGKELREDEIWGKKVLDVIYMGVMQLGDSGVTLRMLLKTRAGEQWGASREFNRRCKLKFDELGIEIPWPQRVVSHKSYAEMDAKDVDQMRRRKRANVLRYVRKTRGEETEEELAVAGMSVEERDRAETMAKREAELVTQKAEESEETPEEIAQERKEEAAKEEAAEDENISDAERLAKKLATRHIKKADLEAEAAKEEAAKEEADKSDDDESKDEDKKKLPPAN